MNLSKHTGRKFLFFGILLVQFSIFSQSIDRSVVNTIGGTSSVISGFIVDYSIGECVVNTAISSNNIYTQGFLQPDTVSIGVFAVSVNSVNESCINANDAFVNLNVLNAIGPVTYYWPQFSDSASLHANLIPGTYVYTVSDNFGNSVTDSVIITSSLLPCGNLDFYNGITPNNDGKNDVFFVKNIESYPLNNMYIYNRYGTKVWEGENYDNVNVLFTGKDMNGSELPPATYFYIFVYDNGHQKKGYVELLR